MTIMVFKLANGHDVLAKVSNVSTGDSGGASYHLLFPALILQNRGAQDIQLQLVPWCMAQKNIDDPVYLNATHVVTVYVPDAGMEKLWEQHHTNGKFDRAGLHQAGKPLRPV